MSFSITVEQSLSADPAHVWRHLSDVLHWSDWTPTVKSVRQEKGADLAPGSTFRVIQPALPQAIWAVDVVQPGHRFIWSNRSPALTIVADHIITPAEGGCCVTLGLTYEGLLAPMAFWLSRRMSQRYIRTEADCLKALCEVSGAKTSIP